MLHRARLGILALALLCACSKGGGSPTDPGGGGGGGDHNPTVNVTSSATHLPYAGIATITVSATDPDGDQLTFSYSATGGTVSSSGPTAMTATFTAGSSFGPCAVTVTASDGKGGTAQATASMYIRNPNPPSFTIAGIGTTTCGGTSCPSCFQVQVTTPEAVVLTEFSIDGADYSGCGSDWTYSGITVNAGQSFTFYQDGNPNQCAAATNCSGNTEHSWNVFILGRRPEPDGATFVWSKPAWGH